MSPEYECLHKGPEPKSGGKHWSIENYKEIDCLGCQTEACKKRAIEKIKPAQAKIKDERYRVLQLMTYNIDRASSSGISDREMDGIVNKHDELEEAFMKELTEAFNDPEIWGRVDDLWGPRTQPSEFLTLGREVAKEFKKEWEYKQKESTRAISGSKGRS